MSEELDLGPLPMPSEEDATWAWRLWNSLQIGGETLGVEGGIWDMPNVGRYRRTGQTELTLTEIHADMMPDRLGISVWHKHDWIRVLADTIGWHVVGDQVEKADSDSLAIEENEPRMEHIGKVWACPCGMVYTLLGAGTTEPRLKVGENGDCINTTCDITIPHPHAGVLNVVNDTAVIAKMEAQELLSIARDEDEYPAPPMDAHFVESDIPPISEEE
jgi:hypothetical protein